LTATGGTVCNALEAAEKLAGEGIDAKIVNISSIKPIDTDLIVQCAKETGKIFTVEDHNVIGGMGSAVCEVLAENYPAKVKRWGLLDKFGESGTPASLYEKYELDAEGIARRVAEFVRG